MCDTWGKEKAYQFGKWDDLRENRKTLERETKRCWWGQHEAEAVRRAGRE